ncbi:ribonuclease H-like domain-containing protein [Tanacetum coccineum]
MKPSNLEYNGWGDGGVVLLSGLGASDVVGGEKAAEEDGVEAACAAWKEGGRRVEARGKGDRVDPATSVISGFSRKSPSEKFSGGGGWWPAAEQWWLPEMRERMVRDEIICSFFAQQASMPTTHDDEDLLQIDEDAMEEIDIRWQVAMITARIRKFMRKTGRPIDLKPKNWITFDKSKIECFNCQKLCHFARECRFAKYQENRANGRQEKRIVAIEDSNSKALVATDNNEDIDWTKEFDAENPQVDISHDGTD